MGTKLEQTTQGNDMTTYINKYWNENGRFRDYEATNICFAQTASEDAKFDNPQHWEETEEEIPENMTNVMSQSGVNFYGHL